MKLKTPPFKLPTIKITKTALLVGAAVVLLLAVFGYGAVRHARTVQEQAVQSQQATDKQAREKRDSDTEIAQLKASVKAEHDGRVAVCGYVTSLAAQKALVKVVSIPAACK